MSLGNSLFRARKNKGLSQEAAAEKLAALAAMVLGLNLICFACGAGSAAERGHQNKTEDSP